jgi:cell division septation protein DedD
VPVPQERRLTKRKTLERLTYIDLPFHNGGIVTDVSEGGLGFHAVAPMENKGPIHFSLSGGSHRIAGIGELMWTDGKGKIGGLRFTELAEEIREQIRKWPLESNLRFEAGKAAAPDLPAAIGTLAVAPALAKRDAQASTDSTPFSYAPYFPEFLPEAQLGKRSSRLLKTIGVSSLAGVIGVAAYLCYREASEWLAATKEGGQDTQTSQGLAPGNAPGTTPNTSSESSEIALVSNAEAASAPAQDAQQSSDRAAPENVAEVGAVPGTSQAQASDAKPGAQAAAKPQAPAAAGEILFVQVAAYTKEADAFKLVYTLRGQHFLAFISPPVTDVYYRVQLGPYSSMEAAQIGKRELEKAGFKPFIRH